jgi:ribosomal-protein-alanine acetyltransferase
MAAIYDFYAGRQPDIVPLAFRPMAAEDVETVIVLEREIYPFPWTPGNFRDAIQAGNSCWIAEADGETVGYGVMLVAAGEAHLLNLGVARPWQRKGLGRRILQHLIRSAREGSAEIMYLEVRPSNLPALALYEDIGFTQIAKRRNYYPAHDGREDAVIMTLPL